MRRSSQSHQPAGVSLAHLVLDFHIARDGPKSRRRYQFFESTSFSARLSNVSSATTCFSFRFSSSNCFSFFASPPSIPPYFAFQRRVKCTHASIAPDLRATENESRAGGTFFLKIEIKSVSSTCCSSLARQELLV